MLVCEFDNRGVSYCQTAPELFLILFFKVFIFEADKVGHVSVSSRVMGSQYGL
jgi:hypothetical protein